MDITSLETELIHENTDFLALAQKASHHAQVWQLTAIALAKMLAQLNHAPKGWEILLDSVKTLESAKVPR